MANRDKTWSLCRWWRTPTACAQSVVRRRNRWLASDANTLVRELGEETRRRIEETRRRIRGRARDPGALGAPAPPHEGLRERKAMQAAQQAAYEALREKLTERHEAIRARQQRPAKAPDEAREHI
jgi:hypothetical protein